MNFERLGEVGRGEERRKRKYQNAAMLMSMLFLFLASSFVDVAVQIAAVDETSGESKLNLSIPHFSFSAKIEDKPQLCSMLFVPMERQCS